MECEICGCKDGRIYGDKNKFGMILCGRHYSQMNTNGRITEVFKNNRVELLDDYAIIYVKRKDNSFNESYIDLELVDFVSKYRWGIDGNGYMHSNILNKTLHSIIMNCNTDMVVDHINQNKLDNRKSNLRIASKSLNAINSKMNKNNKTGIKGVFYNKNKNRYIAYLTIEGSRKNLGSYKDINDAIIARLKGEAKYFKENSPQKHLFNQYGIEVN